MCVEVILLVYWKVKVKNVEKNLFANGTDDVRGLSLTLSVVNDSVIQDKHEVAIDRFQTFYSYL